MKSAWLEIRFSSQARTRMYSARRGTWMSSSCSAAMTGTSSLNIEAMYSSGSQWLTTMCQSLFSQIFSTPRWR